METKLIPKQNHLETEKIDILGVMCEFLDNINLNKYLEDQTNGRPRLDIKEVIKSLLVMNYHSWSYRRSLSDLEILKQQDIIQIIPKRSTLSKYMQDNYFKELLENLIELSASCFIGTEECFMIDGSWFFNKLIIRNSKYKQLLSSRRHGNLFKTAPHLKTRKLHILVSKDSKIITCARTSLGSVHDSKFFNKLVQTTLSNGFKIKTLLGDSAYNSKMNYIFCEHNGINAFLDFKSNHNLNRSKSFLRKEKLILYRENNKVWHQSYRYRVIVEGVFSTIKKKSRYYLRGINANSQDCEILLKVLWYNFGIIAKFMDKI